jgi:hypothetical protein
MGIDGDVIMPAANRVFMFTGANKLTFPHPEMCACLASKCMVWRWDYDEYGDATEGFCGLAGRP